MYWTNDSRGRHVTVALVIVRAPAGRALTGGSPDPGVTGVPPAVVARQGPAGGVACAKAPDAATVANAVRGSFLVRFNRFWTAFAAVAVSAALVASSVTPLAVVSGATASVSTVLRFPASSAVTLGRAPSSSRGVPSITLRLERVSTSDPPVRSPPGSAELSASVTVRPRRDALPVARSATPRAES